MSTAKLSSERCTMVDVCYETKTKKDSSIPKCVFPKHRGEIICRQKLDFQDRRKKMITNLSLIKSLFCTARTIFDCFSCILLQLAHSIYIGTVRHKLLFSFGQRPQERRMYTVFHKTEMKIWAGQNFRQHIMYCQMTALCV